MIQNNVFKKKETLIIFSKKSLKYISLLIILILMIIPLYYKSYDLAKQLTLDKSRSKLAEGIDSIESQAVRALEISNFLRKEDSFRDIFFLKGAPSYENYLEINNLQNKLKSLAYTQDMLSNIYIMFKENPVFISNYISSDNYVDAYNNYLNYSEVSVEEWHSMLFQDNYILKFLPTQKVYSPYYSREHFEGMTCIINNSYYNSIDQKSITAIVFDKEDILKKILYENQHDNCFTYIADSDNGILLSQNYENNKALENVKNLDEITVNSRKYIILTNTSDKLGFKTVVGIPLDIFKKNVYSLLEIIIFYIVFGILVILILSLFFTTKEAFWMKKLVDSASKSTKTMFNLKNEYSYIHNAINQINNINEEQFHKIETLNTSIKSSELKNLLTYGVYSDKEKKELEAYFDNDFNCFCVVKIKYRIDEILEQEKTIQSNITLEIENIFKSLFVNKLLALNLVQNESIFIIFFEKVEDSNITNIKNNLTELIRTVNSNTEVPVIINIGISNTESGVKSVKTAYQQAKYAISINENDVSSGAYVYDPTVDHIDNVAFDIGILVKLYDAVIAGNKTIVSQIFSNSYKIISCYSLSEQERLQIFYSFRQTIYSAYSVIINDKSTMKLPEYEQISDVIKLFNELRDLSLNLCEAVIKNKKSNNEKLKVDIVDYINKNYIDPNLSAYSIATELLISEKYLFSLVKEQTGKSLGKYIEDIRISNAEKLLLETSYSNSQILQMCGFGSENTFYRAFSKKHSVSPNIWKENKRIVQFESDRRN